MKTKIYFILTFAMMASWTNPRAQAQLGYDAKLVTGAIGQANTIDDNCKAEFTVTPDSLANYPYYYHFKDESSGNINSWSWEFGDGKTSSEQNPSHQYDEPGTYNICLTVSNLSDPGNCSDQLCMEVTTMEYFSLGGLVYAGEYPLNNPVITGDTGIASLYRFVNDQIVFIQDNYFQDYGYYWFGFLFPGEYIVKVGLTKGSPSYEKYFTTYLGDEISWTKAEILTISSISNYEADIHLTDVRATSSGPGIIRGYVNFEQGNAYSMPPVSETIVILFDAGHNPLEYTRPNNAGYFEFNSLPYDTYLVSADATGKPSSTLTVILTQGNPVVEGLNLTVFGTNPNFVEERDVQGVAFLKISPNPVAENLSARLYSGISGPVSIQVLDIAGKSHYFQAASLEKGVMEFMIPVADLPAGMYILLIQPEGSNLPVTSKFIR